MFDIGVTKIAIIGGIALIVIGPERLPGLARTLGTLLGRAQRYMADVKAEVNRSMELDELKKMRQTVESAARDVEQTIHAGTDQVQQSWSELESGRATTPERPASAMTHASDYPTTRVYQAPKKNWRLKRGAMPQWYKSRQGVRSKALSGAARVARYRPRPPLT